MKNLYTSICKIDGETNILNANHHIVPHNITFKITITLPVTENIYLI